jgi:hypothetical protein
MRREKIIAAHLSSRMERLFLFLFVLLFLLLIFIFVFGLLFVRHKILLSAKNDWHQSQPTLIIYQYWREKRLESVFF